MGSRDRYELRIARLDGRPLRHDPGAVTEFFNLDDDDEFEKACGRHFVPLASAAEQSRVGGRLREMPFLAEYKLEIRHRNRAQPITASRSTRGWDD